MAEREQQIADEEAVVGKVCSLCSVDLTRWQVTKLPCEHVFHFCCVMDYLGNVDLHGIKYCPVCRQEFLLITLIKEILGASAFQLFRKIILDEPAHHEQSDLMRINHLLVDIQDFDENNKNEQHMHCSDDDELVVEEDANGQMEIGEEEKKVEDDAESNEAICGEELVEVLNDAAYEESSVEESLEDWESEWSEDDFDMFEFDEESSDATSDDIGVFMDYNGSSNQEELDDWSEEEESSLASADLDEEFNSSPISSSCGGDADVSSSDDDIANYYS
ncbi:PREDICTED: origin recognition complex subunit 1-like [Nicrophorus vespilloides]|uniref:Origin recognition complex subunit 1-like n=1 Tax=Nicrophorus vespilloides TaxID=110193 RepID=A0ABM1MF04_NICVS|nr:PREDICTED: origin recognition complex subunit 1-like [Nicrophorus vespilloides]